MIQISYGLGGTWASSRHYLLLAVTKAAEPVMNLFSIVRASLFFANRLQQSVACLGLKFRYLHETLVSMANN